MQENRCLCHRCDLRTLRKKNIEPSAAFPQSLIDKTLYNEKFVSPVLGPDRPGRGREIIQAAESSLREIVLRPVVSDQGGGPGKTTSRNRRIWWTTI